MAASKRKILWVLLGLCLAGACVAAGVFFLLEKREPVNVYPFSYIGMTEYWGDNQESYGPVTTDKIQTVFLSETQTVTELLVKQGDQVKKGDLLMTFDTTLSELQLERKRLEMEKEKLQLEQEKNKLNELLGTTPWEEPPPPPAPPEPSPGVALNGNYELKGGDGSTQDKAVIVWLKTTQTIDTALLALIRDDVEKLQANQPSNPSRIPQLFLSGTVIDMESLSEPSCGCAGLPQCTADRKNECEFCKQGLGTCLGTPPPAPEPPACVCTNLPQCTADQKNECEFCKQGLGTCLGTPSQAPEPPACVCTNLPQCTADQKNECEFCKQGLGTCLGTPSQAPEPPACVCTNLPQCTADRKNECEFCKQGLGTCLGTPPACSCTGDSKCTADKQQDCSVCKKDHTQCTVTEPSKPISTFYIICRTSQEDMSNKEILTWQGLQVTVGTGGFSFRFFPAYYSQEQDPFYVEQEEVPVPDYDFGSGYTAAELHKMINEQRKTIQEQEFKVRVAENAYKIMEKELSDGNIYAEIDGSIVSLLDEEESKLNKQPFLKLSGGGGFLVRGSVSELEKDDLTLGQEVTVSDWNTGGSYPGTIQEIGDFPASGNGWNGMGNPTATFYPFTVFVDESADLQSGIYASIQYSSGSGSHGIYLENPFVRTEEGESYVLVRNGAGRLEKRPVTLGKSLWGSYTEILSGVTEEDFLAFPYGKEARAGAGTREGSLEELYNY